MPLKTLIFIPTYNESENAPRISERIQRLGLDADVLFIDDSSPDGTGKLLEEMKARNPRLTVRHRSGKLGLGSAHIEGINWAYDNGYTCLVTMDCDFTHSPEDIPRLIEAAKGFDLAVGSRFLKRNSLPGWSNLRKAMTNTGHFLTKTLLKMPWDASGAFRVYDLTRIPRELFGLVSSTGYDFFFESLFILSRNKCTINELPIVLPGRVAGNSKMSVKEMWCGITRLLFMSLLLSVQPQGFKKLRKS